MEEDKKETVWEDLFAFGRDLLFYIHRRTIGLLSYLAGFILSGFALTESFKFWLSRKFVRRKGQLSFPFAHATLVGVSLSLLLITTGLGSFIFQESEPVSSDSGSSILADEIEFITEESELLRTEAIIYNVSEKGENIYEIAREFHIPADVLIFANQLAYPYTLAKGQELTVPPFQGLLYRLVRDTTVEQLAKTYKAHPQDIIDFNYLFPVKDGVYRLYAGQVIRIPTYESRFWGATVSPKGSCGDIDLVWPTMGRNLGRGWLPWHFAIDITGKLGEELFAVADGKVVGVGDPAFWNESYGGNIFIDIGDGYQIRYGHMNSISVGLGQEVKVGDVVGTMGSTGNSTGVHLHFELLCNWKNIDPYYYLPE
jgi:murein DD-endopeptidase MepM/ murein hydrolase activator NlpD